MLMTSVLEAVVVPENEGNDHDDEHEHGDDAGGGHAPGVRSVPRRLHVLTAVVVRLRLF